MHKPDSKALRGEQADRQLMEELTKKRAQQDAELLAEFFRQSGRTLRSGKGGIAAKHLPLVLRLTAALRLAQWESTGIASRISDSLPSSANLLKALEQPEIEPGEPINEVGRQLLKIWLTQMAWEPIGESVANVLVTDVCFNDSINLVADLLMQVRHLTELGRE